MFIYTGKIGTGIEIPGLLVSALTAGPGWCEAKVLHDQFAPFRLWRCPSGRPLIAVAMHVGLLMTPCH